MLLMGSFIHKTALNPPNMRHIMYKKMKGEYKNPRQKRAGDL